MSDEIQTCASEGVALGAGTCGQCKSHREYQAVAPKSNTYKLILYLILIAADVAFSALAAAAAARVGARVNCRSHSRTAEYCASTSGIGRFGAKVGAFKVGVLALVDFGNRYGGINWALGVLLSLAVNPFGLALLITAMVSQSFFDELAEPLLVAAIASAWFVQGGMALLTESTPFSIAVPFWDAIGGYVFARVARSRGYDVSSNSAAVFAGITHGVITSLKTVVLDISRGPTVRDARKYGNGTRTTVMNRFSHYEVDDPLRSMPAGTFEKTTNWLGMQQFDSRSYK